MLCEWNDGLMQKNRTDNFLVFQLSKNPVFQNFEVHKAHPFEPTLVED